MRRAVRVIQVLGIASAFGCGTSPADRSSAPQPARVAESAALSARPVYPTACSLINQEEMSRILGAAVAAPKARGATTCTFSPGAENALTPYAEVKIDWDGAEMAMKGMRLAAKSMDQDAGFSVFEKVEGVGDEASMMIGGVMNVRKGSILITIDLRMQTEATAKGSAIANTILARVAAAGART
jgi:hypothetical protein